MNWIQSSRCDSGWCLQMAWQKSSYSTGTNGACLETKFQKSSYSQLNGDCLETKFKHAGRCDNAKCVEIAYRGEVLLRDSKLLDKATDIYHGPILSFPADEWEKFLANLPEKIS